MRNLTIASSHSWDIPFSQLVAAAYDVEHDCTYILSEKQDEVEVLRIDTSDPSEVSAVCLPPLGSSKTFILKHRNSRFLFPLSLQMEG